MINLLFISAAPVLIILTYVYYRDKYEKEPISLLLEGLLAGGVIVLPIIYFEKIIESWGTEMPQLPHAAWTAFMVAALVEETFKYFAVYILIWKNLNFNEKFDGIVYAVFVSLGFALVENIGYVVGNPEGIKIGMLRAFTAVPAHAMFGVMMGFWFGLAKFVPSKRKKYLVKAFAYPFIFHGIYDFILMSERKVLLVLFVPLIIYLFFRARKRIKSHENSTVFNPNVG
jgi:RsiW-degrading membrane proteinase PrsW (M82 family)